MKKKKYSVEAVAAVALLVVMLLVLTGQVVGRYCFNRSNSWSEELSRYLFIWFVLITASLACLEGAHIKVDAAMGLFPPKVRTWIECLGLVVFIIYALVTAYFSGKYTWSMYQMGQVSQGLKLQMQYVYGAIPVCHCLMALRCGQWLVAKIREAGDPPPDEEGRQEP